ncbi:helix-turn-helix domain-containing protein [Candidatus Pacearchaeota archaeon]|nr:helix-turn-helix domain-containing protein [Candidatus Pacearchaeota archaeon]
MNEKVLEEIGLTKGEIKVYLTLLQIGETTTGKIIEEAQISSGKIYEILDKLIKKGLVSYIIKEKTKYFAAASPNRILDYLHEKEKSLKEKEKDFIAELPALKEIEKRGKKEYEIHLFKGFRGFKTAIYEALDELTQKDEILAMGIISTKSEQYNTLWIAWHRNRIKRKIKCRAIFSDKKTEYFKDLKKLKLIKLKVLEGITPTAVDIMGNRVLILTHGKEPSVLSIKNPEISQSFRTFFETLWKIAKN